MNFKDKKIVITGASPDFGLTLAIYFATCGAELFISAQTQREINMTAQTLREIVPGANVHAFVADLCKPAEISKFANDVKIITSNIDILFHNASLWLPGDTMEADDETISNVVNSTLSGTVLITRFFLPLLELSKAPDIINLIARCALPNDRHQTSSEVFSAAKAAHSAFAARLRRKYRAAGLRVISIYPPNFYNSSYLNQDEWFAQRGHEKDHLPTARNVLDCILFALSQDRICSVDDIVMSNTRTDFI